MLQALAERDLSRDPPSVLEGLGAKHSAVARLLDHARDVLLEPPILPPSARGAVLNEFHDKVDTILAGAAALLRELQGEMNVLAARLERDGGDPPAAA